MLNKLKQYITACDICQRTQQKQNNNVLMHARIPETYYAITWLSADIKYMPKGFYNLKFLLIITCQYTNLVIAIPLRDTQARTIAEALIHRVITIFGIPDLLIVDKDRALTGQVINLLLQALQCTQKIISPHNHDSLKTEWQIQTMGNIINKQLTDQGEQWPLFASTAVYAMNTFASSALDGMSPFELVFIRRAPDITKLKIPEIGNATRPVKEYYNLLKERAKLIDSIYLNWKTTEALSAQGKNQNYKDLEIFNTNNLVYLLAPHASSIQTGTMKFRQDFIGPLVIDKRLNPTHYTLCDLIGQTLPDVYHTNWLKQAKVMTSRGIVTTLTNLTSTELLPLTTSQTTPITQRIQNESKNN